MNNLLFKNIFVISLVAISISAKAQIEDILKNKEITWAIEVYNDFVPESNRHKPEIRHINDIKLLKFIDNGQGYVYDNQLLNTLLQDNIKNGKLPIYADSLCKNRIAYSKIANNRVDTIVSIDPVTFEKRVTIAVSGFNEMEYGFLRAHQVLFYNAKKAQFGIKTISIALLLPYYDQQSSVYYKTRYWLKPEDLSKKPNINKKQFTWAHEMVQPKGLTIRGQNVKLVKQSQDNMPIEHLFFTMRTKPKIPFYPTAQRHTPSYTFAKRKELATPSMDTLRIIDPITQFPIPDTFNIVPEFYDKDFTGLRLVQNWYWNNKKKRLEIFMVAAAPILETDMNDYDSVIRRALLYRRNF
jgi:hypothetical protein